MPATKKRTTTKKQNYYKDEIILITTLVVSVLLILSNFNLSGKVGEAVSGFTFGIFGIMAYLIPFLLFFLTAFYLSNRKNKIAIRKVVSSVFLTIIACTILQMITCEYSSKKKIFDYYLDAFHSKSGGGIIGGSIVSLFRPLFGTVGTYVILIALALILIMFITEKFLFAGLNIKRKENIKKRQLNQERKTALLAEKEDNVSDENSKNKKLARNIKTFTIPNDNEEPPKKKLKKSDMKEIKIDTISEISTEQKNNDIPEISTIQSNNDIPEINATQKNDDLPKIINTQKIDDSNNLLDDTDETIPSNKKNNDTIKDLANQVMGDTNNELQKEYSFPPIDLLKKPKHTVTGIKDSDLKNTAIKLQKTLESFGVRVTVTNVSCGPAVTRYELQPEQGVKVSKITNLADDIKLNLAASDIRIEAPIPGKAAVGIEVPNKENTAVMFRELIESPDFKNHSSKIAFAVGKDIGGKTIVTDIGKMPHLLIAGATGSGKSVCINTLIMSILYKANPDDVKLIMIDPKVVELSVYNGIPHLLIPVVTDPKKASAALNWAVTEMTDRYNRFADIGVRDIKGYNEKISTVAEYNDERYQKMSQIVIIVDELADLMMVAPGEVEEAICRIAQLARAAGIHLIIATQRPSVNVITGLIKANMTSRIAFSVSSAIDSRTIIDGSGAEKLLGKGDMLFFPAGYPKPVRVQGAFISDKEVSSVVEFLAKQNPSKVTYNEEVVDKITSATNLENTTASKENDKDEYFLEAGKFIIEKDKASIGMLQRVYKIGFNRAARIMDQLCSAGIVGAEEGTKPRKVLMSLEEFEQYVEEYL